MLVRMGTRVTMVTLRMRVGVRTMHSKLEVIIA